LAIEAQRREKVLKKKGVRRGEVLSKWSRQGVNQGKGGGSGGVIQGRGREGRKKKAKARGLGLPHVFLSPRKGPRPEKSPTGRKKKSETLKKRESTRTNTADWGAG